MSVKDIVDRFRQAGGRIVDAGDHFRLEAPKNLDPELRAKLVRSKAEIRAFFKNRQSSKPELDGSRDPRDSFERWSEMPLSDLEKHDVALKIDSKLLGGPIWLVSGQKLGTKLAKSGIVYTSQEAIIILDLPKEVVKKIHRFKECFDGQIHRNPE